MHESLIYHLAVLCDDQFACVVQYTLPSHVNFLSSILVSFCIESALCCEPFPDAIIHFQWIGSCTRLCAYVMSHRRAS
jgi:hypothetical protein